MESFIFAVMHGLSYLVACGILVPQPGIEPASPALQGGFFFFLNWGGKVLHNFVLVSAVQQHESVIIICVYIIICRYPPEPPFFSPSHSSGSS